MPVATTANGQKVWNTLAHIADRGMQLPFTLGHEVAGEVVAMGDSGRIWVETSGETVALFFPTERNAPRNFAGYYYRSDNNPPQQGDFMGRWRYVVQKQTHWYFCISE